MCFPALAASFKVSRTVQDLECTKIFVGLRKVPSSMKVCANRATRFLLLTTFFSMKMLLLRIRAAFKSLKSCMSWEVDKVNDIQARQEVGFQWITYLIFTDIQRNETKEDFWHRFNDDDRFEVFKLVNCLFYIFPQLGCSCSCNSIAKHSLEALSKVFIQDIYSTPFMTHICLASKIRATSWAWQWHKNCPIPWTRSDNKSEDWVPQPYSFNSPPNT